MTEDEVREVVIIGGGPAGYTAALYAARSNLRPLAIEGSTREGRRMITSNVETYRGHGERLLGPEMMRELRVEAERFGAEFVSEDVTAVDFSDRPFAIHVGPAAHRAEAVIIATGAAARRLGLPSEREYAGRGVSYCAVSDGVFFRDKRVVVVGGGDSAMEEAVYLTRFATKVTVVHRREAFRASPIMVERARLNEKIALVTGAVVEEVLGDGTRVTGVRLRRLATGEPFEVAADGVVVAIGQDPNTKLFVDQLEHDERGYLTTRHHSTETSVPGVFAAGEVGDHVYRQAVTAAGFGCMAALDADRFLRARRGDLLDAVATARPEAEPQTV